jgi:hypothetical protein
MRGRRVAAGGMTVALLGVVGCSGGEEPAGGPTPGPSSVGSSGPSGSSTDGCVVAQRRAARSLGMWRVEGSVPHGPGRGSEVAREAQERLLDKVSQRLAEKCGGVPEAFVAFQEAVAEPLAADLFGDDQYRQVLDAWLAWGESVGSPRAASRAIATHEECAEEFHPYVDATYDLTASPTDTGRVWFLDTTLDNGTGSVLDGSWSGSMRGTAVLPDPFGLDKGPRPGDGRRATLHWGGSSADFLEVQPGVTTQLVAPDADTDVHTTTEGTLRVVEFTAGLSIRGTRVYCSVVVQPSS